MLYLPKNWPNSLINFTTVFKNTKIANLKWHLFQHSQTPEEETGIVVTVKRRYRATLERNHALPSDKTILKWHSVLMTES